MPPIRTLVAALMLATGVLGSRAPAQTAEEADAESPPVKTAAEAADRLNADATAADGPDIFLLPDKDGRLRRVLGYQYEDFFKSWQADGTPEEDEKPGYSISTLNVEVIADGEVANISIRAKVELHGEGWVAIPLHLGSLILEESAVDGGSSRDFLSTDVDRDSYVLWAHGKLDEPRTVTLSGRLPIKGNGEARRLELELPAATQSTVDLTAPGEVRVESDTAVVASATSDDGHTRSRIEGAKGTVAFTWGAPADIDRGAADFEAAVDCKVSVEQGRLNYEGVFSLIGVREPIHRLRIKLPVGAVLSSRSTTGYTVSEPAKKSGAQRSEVEVSFENPTLSPPPIRITAVQSARTANTSDMKITPFQLQGAFRQQGSVAVIVSDQVHAHFEPTGRLRQIEPADLPSRVSSEKALAAFETAGLNWAIGVHTQPRERQVTATPEYKLHLGSQGAVLDVTLNYQVSGGRLFELRVDLRGWELTEQPVQSGGVVNSAEQHVSEDQVLILPLKESDVQQVQIRFALRREAGLGVHDLPLPEPLGAFVLPGNLAVSCDPAWRASALIDRSVGVSPIDLQMETPAAPLSDAGGGDSHDASLRLQTFLPQPRLVVDVSERDQLLQVGSAVAVQVDGQSVRAEQRLDYEILYQPASQLAATVSADLLANEGLELLLDGKPLTSSAVDIQPLPSATADQTDGKLRLVVRLPEPRMGRANITIRSHQSLDNSQRSGKAPISLPLALPDQPAKTLAKVESLNRAVRVNIPNGGSTGDWTLAAPSSPPSNGASPPAVAVELATSKAVTELAFWLEPANLNPPVQTRIEAAWVQTWVAGGMRQDRLTYRFRTSGQRVSIRLPEHYQDVEVLMDREIASVDRTRPELISVHVPVIDADRLHTLELRRHTPLRIGSWGRQSVAFPTIEGASGWSPFFWQLILPPDLSALATPEGMSAEYRLGWHGFRWGREPTQTQRDLERWTGATTAPTPGPRTNQYLFSAFQPPDEAEFIAVRRIWLVIAGGLVVFAIGLAWLYTSIARSAAFWLTACIALGGLVFVYPEAVILAVQAIIVGGAFTILSAVTQWLVARPEPPSTVAPAAAASSVGSLAATQSWAAEPAPASAASSPSGSSLQPSGSAS